ncbi:MAG: hypothetical protein KAT74_09855, partial [Candidatus Cloacimonetes bacterium]|nr:hypothetical protein [Candidatus Cloacimonadota bacterium]
MVDAEDAVMDPDNNAVIVLGHARISTQGASGNHPFWFELDNDDDEEIDVTYTFQHNGDCSSLRDDMIDFIIEEYGTQWFLVDHPSNWGANYQYPSEWIDSELLFHFIMAHVIEHNGDVIGGIIAALNYDGTYGDFRDYFYNYSSTYSINFVLSDGNGFYIFRNNTGNNLSYKCFDSEFVSVKTDAVITNGQNIDQFSLVYVPRNDNCGFPISSSVATFDNIFYNYGYLYVYGSPGDESFQSNSWISGFNYYIIGDIEIPETGTIEIQSNANVYFTGKHCFNINGDVDLMNGSEFNLSHGSSVIVDGEGAELFLDWGSTITGFTPTTYEPNPPGQPVGGERKIPGDRIMCINGGRITTKTETQYINDPGPVITISSSSEELWDGIQIKNPTDETYWFVNCDIRDIKILSMEGDDNGNDGNLNLYHTNFTDGGQIVIRDGHELTIHGNENEYCYFRNNLVIPICAYESPVDLSYVWIGGIEEDDGLENGGGIYLYEASRTPSKIENCNFYFNRSDGVKINNVSVGEFNNNNIENNTSFGMLCYPSTRFRYQHFNVNTLRNNGFAEYAGWQLTYEMRYQDADIIIEDSDYGTGADQYLLMDILWDEINAVDISGTNLTVADLPHLFPNPDPLLYPPAWIFGEGDITPEREMLYSASSDMGNGNYSSAEQTLQQIITDYPLTQEAGIAVYYLYHLENITDQDFTGLINYMESIPATEDTPLHIAIEKIIAKSFMKDKDYLTAIELLETIINNSQIPDEIISAMIDEGYCYLKLSEEGDRALPINCTVNTATLDEYQAKVRELESQFSFYPEEQDQNNTPYAGNIVMQHNFPNPFNPSTTISFELASESDVSIT